MIKWILSLLQKIWNWGMHDGPRLARRVSRDETFVEISVSPIAEWPKESGSNLDDGSNAQRLEEKERDQRSRTSKSSVILPGVGTEYEEVALDYSMKEHFFSPNNPNNR